MDDGDEMRCTDEKLFQLCEKFDKHVERFDKHEQNEEELIHKVLVASHQNTVAIGELTTQVSVLVNDTRDIVQLHKDFQGVARVGSGVQNFVTWCLKWGGIIAAIGIATQYIVEHFSKH